MFQRKTHALRTNKGAPTLTAEERILNQRDRLIDSCQSSRDQGQQRSVSSCSWGDFFRNTLGFEMRDLLSLDRFVRLMCRPCDPASLGVIRILFGFLMIFDVFEERSHVIRYNALDYEEDCIFPLFSFLRPLPLKWMYILCILMLTGSIGIMLGLKMSISSSMFLATFWYLYLLDKTLWNNHSYLFGILAFLFAITDSNRNSSFDALFNPKIKNAHIPLWNYTLMRAQIFIVYFVAGLKKLDMDWISGNSMYDLAESMVFNPFKIFLTEDQINLHIIHHGGFLIDLSLGFILYFDKTRIFGLILCTTFNTMNALIFNIGMFPYAMLVTQLFFCDMDWPRKVFRVFTFRGRADSQCQPSSHCIYPKDPVKSENSNAKDDSCLPTSSSWKHTFASIFTVTFIVWQLFLPYSHGITKGYNTWTGGLYGYSWDMMIHGWETHHLRVTYHDQTTGQTGYLDPEASGGYRRRWYSHGDMIKQYAHCIANKMRNYNLNNVSLYFDIWLSMNRRFQQRYIDPRVDIVQAEWNPFESPSWLLPLLADLTDWRSKLIEIEASLDNDTFTNVVFLADFPGLWLENYVQPDFDNTTLTVLAGSVIVEFVDSANNVTLAPNQSVKITADAFHKVHTVSETPSCYMYVYVNSTRQAFIKNYLQFEEDYNRSSSFNETLHKYKNDPNLPRYKQILAEKQTKYKEDQKTFWELVQSFFIMKYHEYKLSVYMNLDIIYFLATKKSLFDDFNTSQLFEARSKDFDARSEDLDARSEDLDARSKDLDARSEDFDARSEDLDVRSEDLDARNKDLDARSEDLDARSEGYMGSK